MLQPNSYLTTDALLIFNKKEVLLIERKNEPFQQKWALPGGFVDSHERIRDAAVRELWEETGIRAVELEEFGTYGDPGRDPRGRTVSIVYWALLSDKPEAKPGDDAAGCRWFRLDQLPELAFDHAVILADAKKRLQQMEISEHHDFLDWLDKWFQELSPIALSSLLKEFPAEQTALISVDVVNGFCKQGNLASPRIAAIVPPVVELFKQAEREGIHNYVLLQDTHPENSKEFLVYPPHCTEGSAEAKTVQELIDLPHAYKFQIIPKRTINPAVEARFEQWLSDHDQIRQFLVVGDCTDICVYLLSLYIKTWCIQRNVACQVVVPANCVDTFDLPLAQTKGSEVLPHPGELLHRFFLYHLQMNGMRIVRSIE